MKHKDWIMVILGVWIFLIPFFIFSIPVERTLLIFSGIVIAFLGFWPIKLFKGGVSESFDTALASKKRKYFSPVSQAVRGFAQSVMKILQFSKEENSSKEASLQNKIPDTSKSAMSRSISSEKYFFEKDKKLEKNIPEVSPRPSNQETETNKISQPSKPELKAPSPDQYADKIKRPFLTSTEFKNSQNNQMQSRYNPQMPKIIPKEKDGLPTLIVPPPKPDADNNSGNSES